MSNWLRVLVCEVHDNVFLMQASTLSHCKVIPKTSVLVS